MQSMQLLVNNYSVYVGIFQELYPKKSSETVVEYMNPCFQESKTSVSTINLADCSAKNNENKKDNDAENCDKDPR